MTTLAAQQVTPKSRTADDDPTAGAVLLAALGEQIDHLLAQEPRIRSDAPDAVAEMRVGTRRLRCVLVGFRRALDQRQTGPILTDLKWLGSELADERDTEVMAARFAGVLTEMPHELVHGPIAADLDAALGQRAEEDLRRILAALDGPRYAGLQNRLRDLLMEPSLTNRAGRPAHLELPRDVARAYRRLDRTIRLAVDISDEIERTEALHEARKAGKRVRYMCEVAVPVIGKPAKRLRRRTEKLQQLLGEHQDAAVARPTLHSLGLQADRLCHSAFTYGVLYAAEHFRARDVERELPAMLDLLRAPEATDWLTPGAVTG